MLLLMLFVPSDRGNQQSGAIDFATLDLAAANRLEGDVIRVRLTTDSLEWEFQAQTLYECNAVDAVSRCVRFTEGQEIPEGVPIVVEG